MRSVTLLCYSSNYIRCYILYVLLFQYIVYAYKYTRYLLVYNSDVYLSPGVFMEIQLISPLFSH